jgi:hypothetical protein
VIFFDCALAPLRLLMKYLETPVIVIGLKFHC